MKKHILFVEDEATQLDMFESAVGDWNAEQEAVGKTFTFDVAKTVEEAHSLQARLRYDAALFDLRVASEADGGSSQPRGNELARQTLKERGIPVAVISANTGEIDEDIRAIGAVEVFDKNDLSEEQGNYYDRALAWLGGQWDMMDVLAQARQAMDASAADIFLLRLWPRWKMFAELETADRDQLVRIVTRQYVSHMADLLGLDDPDNVTWHPFENYVSPALMSGRAHTGDIFRFEDGLWVVLTPQCDMATQKVPNVILAECRPGVENWNENIAALRAADSNKKRKEPTNFLRSLVNQNIGPARHFLPPLPQEDTPLEVHFSSMKAIPMAELNQRLPERVASISSPFLSNIIQRFGAYVSRMGQPNIDVNRFL